MQSMDKKWTSMFFFPVKAAVGLMPVAYDLDDTCSARHPSSGQQGLID